jgi:hypothetical protein
MLLAGKIFRYVPLPVIATAPQPIPETSHHLMGWSTTFEPDRFAAAAGGYLRSRAAENTLLLSAAQAARLAWRTQVAGSQPGAAAHEVLFGWWEPPDGGEPRGAFVHDPAVPLLIAGKAPEIGTALAATLAKTGRHVSGVDAPTEVADAFAAAWSQRSGTTVRAHKNTRVYRLAAVPRATGPQATEPRPTPPLGSPQMPGPPGRLRRATTQDLPLLADWLTAFAIEATERITAPAGLAADLVSRGGAVFWEVPQRPSRLRDAAHQPVALVTLARPVAGAVRISMVYTPRERRHHGYATALTLAVSRAVLTPGGPGGPGAAGAPGQPQAEPAGGRVNEVVMITDKNRSDRWGSRLGYQLVGERAVLRFGPVTGPVPRTHPTGAMPRLPTGPLPRLPRNRR